MAAGDGPVREKLGTLLLLVVVAAGAAAPVDDEPKLNL